MPRPNIPYVVDRDVAQSRIAEHFCDALGTCGLRPSRRGDRRQRGLTRQCRFIGAFDKCAGRADAIVREERVDHGANYDLWRGFCNLNLTWHTPGATLDPWTSASLSTTGTAPAPTAALTGPKPASISMTRRCATVSSRRPSRTHRSRSKSRFCI